MDLHVCSSLQAPHTMPTMSSTSPATIPPRSRPTAVVLVESVFAGQVQSLSASAQMTDTGDWTDITNVGIVIDSWAVHSNPLL